MNKLHLDEKLFIDSCRNCKYKNTVKLSSEHKGTECYMFDDTKMCFIKPYLEVHNALQISISNGDSMRRYK